MNILSRLDKTKVFCDADDFYQDNEAKLPEKTQIIDQ